MDSTTLATKQMYEEFPYPSREVGSAKFNELRNLLHIFALETGFDLSGKAVLDAGVGTGHRLAAAAAAFPGANYTAVDLSENSLAVARLQPALKATRFEQMNLLGDLSGLGTFDVVLCMGVLHHLSSPGRGLANLVNRLKDDGIIFLYVYGARGVAERTRRKAIVSTLLGADPTFATGIQLVKELGFDSFEYGWNVETGDNGVRDGLLVDAYLNVHEASFTSDTLETLLAEGGLSGFAIFGITTAQAGYLFDAALVAKSRLGIPRTDPSKFLLSDLARTLYERLPLRERIRVLDLWYQPNGYTTIGFKKSTPELLNLAGRLERNTLRLQLPKERTCDQGVRELVD